jgi:glutaredoxin
VTPRLTLYSKPGCHLCDEMKLVIDAVRSRVPLALEVVDISTDPALMELYGVEIPVLMIDGKKAAKYRITAAELEKKLGTRGAGLTTGSVPDS